MSNAPPTTTTTAPTQDIRILVIDPDEKFGNRLRDDHAIAGGKPIAKTPQPVWGTSLRETQKFLSDRDFSYVAIFINPSIGHPSWTACIKNSHQYRPGMPVYIMYDEPPKGVTPEQQKELGVTGFVKLPLDYREILKILSHEREVPVGLGAQGEPIHAQPAAPVEPPQKGLALKDSDLLTVNLKNRIGSVISPFDLFIKLSNGRYVQISKSGDKLTQDRLDKYKEHGAEALYVLKSQQEGYLKFCDEVVANFIRDPKIPISEKTAEVARYGEETVSYLKNAGFTPATLKRAEEYVAKITETIGTIAVGSGDIKAWFENVLTLEHAVGVTTIAGVFLKNIGVLKPETYQAVGIACFLHDIGLIGMPAEVLEEDESKMTADQKKMFREHPIIGGKKLAQDKTLPPGVAKAVEQHHIRANGGFPSHPGVQELSIMAEIIGISEDFFWLLKKAKANPRLDPLQAIREIALKDYSKTLASGFLKTLQEK
ncbi:HD domain-containing phosphohydrolase [Bdellovibrionota bacterium FG-1]